MEHSHEAIISPEEWKNTTGTLTLKSQRTPPHCACPFSEKLSVAIAENSTVPRFGTPTAKSAAQYIPQQREKQANNAKSQKEPIIVPKRAKSAAGWRSLSCSGCGRNASSHGGAVEQHWCLEVAPALTTGPALRECACRHALHWHIYQPLGGPMATDTRVVNIA